MLTHKTIFNGTQINYLYICQTKVWFFSHHLSMEHSSDLVS
ncbi:MAG: Dna2/Cas4 domain-containing protein, partial [Fervidobacterium sp.]